MKVDFDEVALRTGTGRGITDVKGLLKSADQQASETADAQNANVTQAAVPHIVKGAMDIAKNPQAATAISEAMNATQSQ
jgi:hypothetical protein